MRRLAAVALLVLAAPVPGAAAPTPSQLLARHRPVLVLHPAERFAPVDVGSFVAASRLEYRLRDGQWAPVPGGSWLPADAPCVDGVTCRLNVAACAPLWLASVECYANAVRGRPAIYGFVHRVRRGLVLQYWLLYAYNFWSPAYPPADVLWRSHEGDWEQISVFLARDQRPHTVAYSRHCGGARREWRATEKWRRTQRPVVYVALGSHANYFAPGRYRHERRCYPAAALEVFRVNRAVPTDVAARGAVVAPPLQSILTPRDRRPSARAKLPSWIAFPGTWGETAYFHVPNVGPVGFGAGPVGPQFHTTYRRPETMLRWPLDVRR